MFYGTIDGASIHPRIVVRKALGYNAAAIIVAHNHPSGVAEPSHADRIITLKIVRRLQGSAPVPDISAVTPNMNDSTFEALARSVRECIDRNEPETGLYRLHTFLVKYFRVLCAKRGIETGREKPLHSQRFPVWG